MLDWICAAVCADVCELSVCSVCLPMCVCDVCVCVCVCGVVCCVCQQPPPFPRPSSLQLCSADSRLAAFVLSDLIARSPHLTAAFLLPRTFRHCSRTRRSEQQQQRPASSIQRSEPHVQLLPHSSPARLHPRLSTTVSQPHSTLFHYSHSDQVTRPTHCRPFLLLFPLPLCMDRFFRSAHSGEHPSISSRRTFEDSRLTLDNQQSISVKLLEHAAWQKRSDGIVARHALSRHVQHTRQTDSDALQERRNALRQLIVTEEAEQKAEMLAMMETAEERASRVLDEARRLKADRERRREVAAAEGYSQQWKERCDDLRTIDSHFFARHCAEVVEQQMDDSASRRMQQREKERQYAAEWENSRQEKIRQEDDKQRRRKEAVLDNRAALREQMEVHREMERQQKERQAREKEIHVRRTHSSNDAWVGSAACARRAHLQCAPCVLPLLSNTCWRWMQRRPHRRRWRNTRERDDRTSASHHLTHTQRTRRPAPE